MGENLRLLFATEFGSSNELRKLAADIARAEMSAFLCRGRRRTKDRVVDYPLNFLANGSVAESRKPKKFTLPEEPPNTASGKEDREYARLEAVYSHLRDWKYSCKDQFFTSPGLALLFDPWVDTSLAAHLLQSKKLPDRPTVILLSDYYPLGALLQGSRGILEAFADGTDWAESLVRYNLALTTWPDKDVTARKLYRALRPGVKDPSEDYVTELFVKNRLLLWNFLPMFRGGFDHSNQSGLPSGDLWVEECLSWTRRFLRAVKPANLLVLCSGSMLPTLSIPVFKVPAEYERCCLLCDRVGPILKWTDSKSHDCLRKIVGVKDSENGSLAPEHVFRIRQPSGWRGSGLHHADIFRAAIRHFAGI
jgi:hypothetical protein